VKDLDEAGFGRAFVAAVRDRGLGNFTKRELDVLILHLLETHSGLAALSNGDAGLLLRAPASRIRALRLDSALRFAGDLHGEFRKRLTDLVQKSRLRTTDGKVVLVVEDSFTRDVLLSELKKHQSYGSWSFNSELVTVDVDALVAVLVSQMSGAELADAKRKLKESSDVGVVEALRALGGKVFGRLEETAVDGVANVTAEALRKAAQTVAPHAAALLLRIFAGG
jgi:hypothetical protein